MIWLLLYMVQPAFAAGLPLDPSGFGNPFQLAADSVSKAIIKTVGIAADQRPYQPATPLGTTIGLDFGIEMTLVRISDDFRTALTSAGRSGDTIPVFPVPRLQIHKGIGERVDIGGSFVGYRGYSLIGGDLKVVVYMPEEGLTWAIRGCYSSAKMDIVKTQTITPQVLASRRLDFANPYLGIGYQFITGSISMPEVNVFSSNSGSSFIAFMGVELRAKVAGLKLTLEGSYSGAGSHTLGTNFGFNF